MSTLTEAQNALVNVVIDSAPSAPWELLVLQHARIDIEGLYASMGACAAFGTQKDEIPPTWELEAAIGALYAAYDAAEQPFHQFELEVQNASNQFRYRFEFGRLPATTQNAKQRVAMADRFSRFSAARTATPVAPAAQRPSTNTSPDALSKRVIEVLASSLTKAAEATERTQLAEDMKLTGAELLQVGMFIEDEFGVQLPLPNYPADFDAMSVWLQAPVGVSDVGELKSVGDIVAYVRERF